MQNLQRQKDKLENELRELRRGHDATIREDKKAKETALMMMIPAESKLVKAPTLFPKTGATRHFTRTFTLESTAPNQNFGLKLSPDIRNFYSHHVGDTNYALTNDLVANFEGSGGGQGIFRISDATPNNQGAYVEDAVFDVNAVDRAGFSSFFWNTTKTGNLYNVVIRSIYSFGTTVTVRVFHNGTYTDYVVRVWDDPSGFTALLSSGADTWEGIGFKCDSPITAKFIDTAATSITLNSLTRPLISDELIERGQLSTYRVSAMSVLCSYRGNLLENSGVIAGLRAPSDWAPEATSLYSAITKVPDFMGKGPLIKGMYTWWLPMDMSELDFRSVNLTHVDGTSLYIGGVFTDMGGALEVTVDIVVDFFSPLQIFERVPFPALTDPYVRMIHELAALPAVTCNPSHIEVLRKGVTKAAKAVKSGVSYGVEFAKAHPEYVELLLKGLTTLL